MSIIVVRHGLSEANNRENIGTVAFGSGDAPLMELGREQARAAGARLLELYAADPNEPVAVSTYLRTQQTASEAGFAVQTPYPQLREAERLVPYPELKALLRANRIPDNAVSHAEALLQDPPRERIWFTHGLVIAGLCQIMGVHTDRLKPGFAEIRELDI